MLVPERQKISGDGIPMQDFTPPFLFFEMARCGSRGVAADGGGLSS
jgi:hypothetical protein